MLNIWPRAARMMWVSRRSRRNYITHNATTPSPPALPSPVLADCGVLLSGLRGEPHPDLHTCDGSRCADSVRASTIPAFWRSVTEEALVRTYANGTPVYSDAKSAHRLTARCSKCHVFSGDKARLSATDLRTAGWATRTGTPGSVFICHWIGLLTWMVPLTRMQPHAHATVSVDVAALSVQVRLQ